MAANEVSNVPDWLYFLKVVFDNGFATSKTYTLLAESIVIPYAALVNDANTASELSTSVAVPNEMS